MAPSPPLAPRPALPSIFVSHGAPDLLLTPGPAREFLSRLGPALTAGGAPPRFALVASAHWLARSTQVDVSARPSTIHDFSGFGPELEAVDYPARGEPDVARRAAELLRAAGLAATTAERGLDH